MSSKASKFRENVKAVEAFKKYELYGSLLGSCIVTVGKIAERTEKDILKDFDILKKDKEFWKCENVIQVLNYLYNYYDVSETIELYKDLLVLVYDESDMYTPQVTLCVDRLVYPLDPEGTSAGILSLVGKEGIVVEYIYEPERQDEV